MYVQKNTYTYIHHTDMSVFDTYMSVSNTDKTECACICMNVYVCGFHRNSIAFLLSLYDVCIFGIDTSTYIHVWICMYDVCILSLFCLNSASILNLSWAHTAPVSAPVSARLHRRLRGHIAVASPHRIGSASHRCTKRRRLANFIRIKGAADWADSLHADWRSGASTTAGSGRSDDEDICRSHGREVVTRWSSKSYAMHRPMRSIELKHCTAQSTQKTQKIKPWYAVLCTIP